MAAPPGDDTRWSPSVRATLVTIWFAVAIVWSARSFGRTVIFAISVNWMLIFWAIWVGRVLESRNGAWDGISCRLPASYYALRPFEEGGRIYDYLGVRWYQRLLRRVLWSVKPALLRSQPDARQSMIRDTHGPEAGHLVIFVVILGITLWPLASRWWKTVAWLLLFNLLHNAYPVMSLRQIRARLERQRPDNAITLHETRPA
jgi:hypothetical protein